MIAFSLLAKSACFSAHHKQKILFPSPYNEIENLPIPTKLNLKKNSVGTNVPCPAMTLRTVASPISNAQNVPCATVSILLTVAFEKGSQVRHIKPKEHGINLYDLY